jgi:plastocyanin
MTMRPSISAHTAPAVAWQRAVVAAGVLLLGAIAASPAFPAEHVAGAPATTHTVVIKATSYAPQALTIKRGDTVVWVNEDPFPHTVTAAGAFDSKSIAAGASWKYTPRHAGEYAYTCTFHPNMKGTLRVEEPTPH